MTTEFLCFRLTKRLPLAKREVREVIAPLIECFRSRHVSYVRSLLLVMGIFIGCDTATPAPQMYGDIPQFQLVNSEGKPVVNGDLQGKIWVGHLFFSRCPHECPRMFRQLLQLREEVEQKHSVKLGIFSVSIDPLNDTPPVLAEMRIRYVPVDAVWILATGEMSSIKAFATRGLKLAAPEDPSLHSARYALIDQKGQLRGFYLSTDKADMNRLYQDIVALHTL
jgi:protein SCO1